MSEETTYFKFNMKMLDEHVHRTNEIRKSVEPATDKIPVQTLKSLQKELAIMYDEGRHIYFKLAGRFQGPYMETFDFLIPKLRNFLSFILTMRGMSPEFLDLFKRENSKRELVNFMDAFLKHTRIEDSEDSKREYYSVGNSATDQFVAGISWVMEN